MSTNDETAKDGTEIDHIRFEEDESEVGTWVRVYDEQYNPNAPGLAMEVGELKKLGTAIVDEYGRIDDE